MKTPTCRGTLTALLLWSGLLLGTLGTAGAAANEGLEIADADGRPVLTLVVEPDQVRISDGAGKPRLQGTRSAPGRTEYRLPDGTAFCTATGDPDGIKLFSPDGRLLRKAKRDGDRIKVADNLENSDPAILRRRGLDKWELEIRGESLGKIKEYPAESPAESPGGQARLKVKDREEQTRYTLTATPLNPVPLLLLMPGLPPGQAQALMAEMRLRRW